MRSIKFSYVLRLLFGASCFLPNIISAQTPGFPGGNLPNRSWASGGGSIVLGYAVQNESPFASGMFAGSNSYRININAPYNPI